MSTTSASSRLAHRLRRLLIVSHRYLGIPLSALFIVWFASAFVMIYAGGMPTITQEMRIAAAAPLDFDQVRLSVDEAALRLPNDPPSARLKTVLDRPAYEFGGADAGAIVFADTGEFLTPLTEAQARTAAARFLGVDEGSLSGFGLQREMDQWTLVESRSLPLYKFAADDGLGTEVYVSPANGEVMVYTTRQARTLAWLGTIPHWLYFSGLRSNQPLWYALVVWSATVGCILVLLGLILAVTQLRKVRPFSFKRAIPYRGGLRWHYIAGSVFGLVTLTWLFSGLLSMEPYAWTQSRGINVDRQLYTGGSLDYTAFPESIGQTNWADLADGEIKQIEFRWIQGAPHYLAFHSEYSGGLTSVRRDRLHQPYQIAGQLRADSVLVDARSSQVRGGFEPASLVRLLDEATVGASAVEYDVLGEYDSYYYSRNRQLPLPVLRVKFDDPLESWIYVDPGRSELLALIDRWNRVERWLYNGLHSLDFAFWYHKRPLWDIGVILLLAGGLVTSCLGFYLGMRRLVRDAHALAAALRQRAAFLLPPRTAA